MQSEMAYNVLNTPTPFSRW